MWYETRLSTSDSRLWRIQNARQEHEVQAHCFECQGLRQRLQRHRPRRRARTDGLAPARIPCDMRSALRHGLLWRLPSLCLSCLGSRPVSTTSQSLERRMTAQPISRALAAFKPWFARLARPIRTAIRPHPVNCVLLDFMPRKMLPRAKVAQLEEQMRMETQPRPASHARVAGTLLSGAFLALAAPQARQTAIPTRPHRVHNAPMASTVRLDCKSAHPVWPERPTQT